MLGGVCAHLTEIPIAQESNQRGITRNAVRKGCRRASSPWSAPNEGSSHPPRACPATHLQSLSLVFDQRPEMKDRAETRTTSHFSCLPFLRLHLFLRLHCWVASKPLCNSSISTPNSIESTELKIGDEGFGFGSSVGGGPGSVPSPDPIAR